MTSSTSSSSLRFEQIFTTDAINSCNQQIHWYSKREKNLTDPDVAAAVLDRVFSRYIMLCPLVDQTYPKYCGEVLKKFPDLHEKIVAAHAAERYDSILRFAYDYFHPNMPPSPIRKDRAESDDMKTLMAAYQAFRTPLVGNSHHLLCDLMDTLRDARSHKVLPYNHSISIISSSGMGKSRTVDAVAGMRFCFPFNLRAPLELGQSAYPPADIDVQPFLLRRARESDPALQLRYIAFFTALFDLAIPEIQKVFKKRSNEFIPKIWQSYLAVGETKTAVGPNRKDFYARVVDQANKISFESLDDATTVLDKTCNSFTRLLENQFTASSTNENKRLAENPVQFFLYFDEAHDLMVEKGTNRSPFHMLGHVLSQMIHLQFFVVFLSTNSGLGGFAPTHARHPSVRDWGRWLLHTPFTELPFDSFAYHLFDSLLKANPNGVKLADVCTVEHIVKFGRPLWATLYNCGDTPLKNQMVSYAMNKLSPSSVTEVDKDVCYAALGIRVILDFDIARESSRVTEAKLVESYLRVPFAVANHREFMRAGAPSEPILAEAAGILLDPHGANELQKIAPETLVTAFKSGLLAKGERGEMILRLFWTLAHDVVTNRIFKELPVGVDHAPILRFHRPIRVLDWLKALFNPKWHDVILNARPLGDSTNGLTLENAFQDVYLHFSHFTRADDHSVIGLPLLWGAFVRGMAYQCADNQQSTDVVAPLHHGGLEAPIGSYNTSPLFGQAKNRLQSSSVLLNPFIAGEYQNDLPVLSLLMEFGVSNASVCSHDPIEFPALCPLERKRTETIHKTHYQIDAYGATNETYAVVRPDMVFNYQSILGVSKVIDDFVRDGKYREALLRQKPAFYAGTKESWDWLSEDAY